MFFSLSRLYLTLTTIKTSEFSTLGRCFLKRVGDVEPNYTDGSICIREAENETCEVQRDGVVTYIGMLERYNAYILTKRRVIV
jgi:hypothetical protein